MTFASKWAVDIFKQKYSKDGVESWSDTARRVVTSVCADRLRDDEVADLINLVVSRRFIPAGRYLYASGREFHQVNNCFLFRARDSREGWAELMSDATAALMTGGGIGVDYSAIRPFGSVVRRTGGFATGPISLANMVNEAGRFVMQGGQRRSAIWGGLLWRHPDILPREVDGARSPGWLYMKDWSPALRAAKAQDLHFALPMELTNISVIYDTEFFDSVDARGENSFAWRVFVANCRQAFRTAEPGFSFNFRRDRESLRNACTEIVSEDDGDKCNLGTVWLNYCTDLDDFARAVRLAVKFLMCGGLYSHVPNSKIASVGAKNNRIGLGVGGFHEWLMMRGADYEVTPELRRFLEVYRDESDQTADVMAVRLEVPRPKGVRAIAPNGTIGILAETTTSIEPLFCKAYLRRYVGPDQRIRFQYVVDGAVRRLLAAGVPVERIQDAYDLSFEQRVAFQADVQDFVDMAISSTCNMPHWGSKGNNEGTVEAHARVLYSHAKRLRGFTCYPDGARSGQPLERVDDLEFALNHEGQVFEERVHECLNGICSL